MAAVAGGGGAEGGASRPGPLVGFARDPGGAALAGLAIAVAALGGAMPCGEGFPGQARAVAVLASVLWLPGALLGPVLSARIAGLPGFGVSDGPLARFAGAQALSLAILCPLALAALAAGLSWGAAEAAFRVALAAAAIARLARPSVRRPDPPGRAEALLGVLAILAALAAARMGAVSASDAAVHRAAVRALLREDRIASPRAVLLAGEGEDPRYALPAWHALAALSARMSGADPDAIWRLWPAVGGIAPIGAAIILGAALFGSRRAGVRCGAFALGMFALLGHPATRLAPYYQIPSLYVMAPCAWAVALSRAREGGAGRLGVIAAFGFAAAALNPFYGAVLPGLSFAAAAGWLLAVRGAWRPVAMAGLALAAGAAPVIAIRAARFEFENPAYRNPEKGASAAFRSILLRDASGRAHFRPVVLLHAGFWGASLLQGVAILVLPLALRGRFRSPAGGYLAGATLLPCAVLPCPFLCGPLADALTPIYASHLAMLIPGPYLLGALARRGEGESPRAGPRFAAVAAASAGLAVLAAIVPFRGGSLIDSPIRRLEASYVPWPRPLLSGPAAPRVPPGGGVLGRVSAEARGLAHASLFCVRAAVAGVPWDDAEEGALRRIASILRRGPRGTVLTDSETGLEIAASTGFPVIHVPPFHASPGIADLPARAADLAAVLSGPGVPDERPAILDRWGVRYAVLPADVPPDFLPGRWRRVASDGPFALLAREAPPGDARP